jgi:hypothetical protein
MAPCSRSRPAVVGRGVAAARACELDRCASAPRAGDEAVVSGLVCAVGATVAELAAGAVACCALPRVAGAGARRLEAGAGTDPPADRASGLAAGGAASPELPARWFVVLSFPASETATVVFSWEIGPESPGLLTRTTTTMFCAPSCVAVAVAPAAWSVAAA